AVPGIQAWIDRAVDQNSRSELAAPRTNVELAVGHGADLVMSLEDSIRVDAAAKDMYDFVNEAGLWTERLAHVSWVSLVEKTPGEQILALHTQTKDGGTHRTDSVRVCVHHPRTGHQQT